MSTGFEKCDYSAILAKMVDFIGIFGNGSKRLDVKKVSKWHFDLQRKAQKSAKIGVFFHPKKAGA